MSDQLTARAGFPGQPGVQVPGGVQLDDPGLSEQYLREYLQADELLQEVLSSRLEELGRNTSQAGVETWWCRMRPIARVDWVRAVAKHRERTAVALGRCMPLHTLDKAFSTWKDFMIDGWPSDVSIKTNGKVALALVRSKPEPPEQLSGSRLRVEAPAFAMPEPASEQQAMPEPASEKQTTESASKRHPERFRSKKNRRGHKSAARRATSRAEDPHVLARASAYDVKVASVRWAGSTQSSRASAPPVALGALGGGSDALMLAHAFFETTRSIFENAWRFRAPPANTYYGYTHAHGKGLAD